MSIESDLSTKMGLIEGRNVVNDIKYKCCCQPNLIIKLIVYFIFQKSKVYSINVPCTEAVRVYVK